MESDNVGVTVIGTHFLDLSQISNDGDKGELTGEHGRGTLAALNEFAAAKLHLRRQTMVKITFPLAVDHTELFVRSVAMFCYVFLDEL